MTEPGPEGPRTHDLEALLGALSLEEKAALTAGVDNWTTVPVPRLGLPALRLTDGPAGARGATRDHESVTPSVCIPSATALGASFDPSLVARASAVVARQAREKQAQVLLAPTVNLHRHPLWGRNFECFSEDPLLTARLGVAYIAGVQSEGVSATVKHFVGNETELERNTSSSEIDERTLRECYLLPFEHAVRSGVWALMTAYNRLNGHHLPDSERLLRQVLREEWGFEGLVMTDWFGLLITEEAGAAGLDLEMPGPARSFGPYLEAAVREGRVKEADLDEKVRRLLALAERVGALDEPPGGEERPVDRPEDRALLRQAAGESLVLLTNDGLLPFEAGTLHRLAVVGPQAAETAFMGGGSAKVTPHHRRSLLEALRDRLGDRLDLVHEPGTGEAGIAAAVEAARDADAVLVAVGTDHTVESEGYDRTSMDLPGDQDELVRQVLAANPRSVVVVCSGAPVTMAWASGAGALLQSFFGGQEVAEALVDVLLGEAEPGGRLPTTLPLRLEHTPAYGTFPGESSRVRYGEGLLLGYRFYESRHLPVRFPFGHGLSYTSFELGAPTLSTPRLERDGRLEVELTVTNTGDRRGAEVVQCYVAPPTGARTRPGGRFRPVKELRGFAKVWLDPGESATVTLPLVERSFAYYDVADEEWPELQRRNPHPVNPAAPPVLHRSVAGWYVDPGTYALHLGRSSAAITHVVEVEVRGGEEPLPGDAPLG